MRILINIKESCGGISRSTEPSLPEGMGNGKRRGRALRENVGDGPCKKRGQDDKECLEWCETCAIEETHANGECKREERAGCLSVDFQMC